MPVAPVDSISRRRFPRLALVLLATACLSPRAAPATPAEVDAAGALTVLVLGDSLSSAYGFAAEAGWVELLARRLDAHDRASRVVNASVSGDTTRGALARLDPALAMHEPDVVVVAIGGNDGLRGLPLDEIRANLAAIVEHSRAAGARVLLVQMRLPPNLGPVYGERFRDLYTSLGEALDVTVAEFPLAEIALDPELIQDDGIHPTAVAQPLIVDALWPPIANLIARNAKKAEVAAP